MKKPILYRIARGQTSFQMGLNNPSDLQKWLLENPDIKGACFVGRSNVGKSTLINALFGNKVARTSKTPGRTRQINIFTFKLISNTPEEVISNLYLFDLPGYGHAEVSKSMSKNWDKLLDTFFHHLPTSICIINLQDARHHNQKSDQAFQQYIENFNLETLLVLNKIDKLKKQKEKAALQKSLTKVKSEYKWINRVICVSAEKKTGITEVNNWLINFILNN